MDDAGSEDMLTAAEVEETPLMPLLAEAGDVAEKDWTARREVAIAKTISL